MKTTGIHIAFLEMIALKFMIREFSMCLELKDGQYCSSYNSWMSERKTTYVEEKSIHILLK